MTRRRWVTVALGAMLIALIAGGTVIIVRARYFGPTIITAYFTNAAAIYPGDQVRVSGVTVGTISAIEPKGAVVKMTLRVEHDVRIPADAKAVIVAPNLLSARYVQLAPAFHHGSEPMRGGATIPLERTAVPVEWDEVKAQLMRLATDLGPVPGGPGSASRLITSAAQALHGNGDKLRQTFSQLAGLGRILSDGSGNIVDVLKNLQTFVTTLRDSNTQIVQFESRFATLTSVLNDSQSDLDAALTNLSVAVGDVKRFIEGIHDPASEQAQRLANVTQAVADHATDLANILHAAPTAYANGYNVYGPDNGAPIGQFVLNNFANPTQFICSAIGAVENVTAPETAKLCAQYLGPALRLLNFNYSPLPINPFLMPIASPDNTVYSEPRLAPGGAGPKVTQPPMPPRVSAYSGLDNDVPAPPASPPPPILPRISSPQSTLPQILLPAEGSDTPSTPPVGAQAAQSPPP